MAAAQALMTKFFRPTDPTKPYWMTLFEKEEAERKVRTRDRLDVGSRSPQERSCVLSVVALHQTQALLVFCVYLMALSCWLVS